MTTAPGELADLAGGELCEPEGLRERKKAATRRALSVAAMHLAAERGLENVLIDDIAAQAGVSARTFSNYFGSKHEAICALAMERSQRIGAELRDRPADEPLMEAVTNAVTAAYGAGTQVPDKEWIDGVRLVIRSPALQGEYLKTQYAAQRTLAAAIADRTGTDPDADMFPAVLAGAVAAAMLVAQDGWLSADPPVAVVPLIRQALGALSVPFARLADSEVGCDQAPSGPILATPESRNSPAPRE